MKRKYKMWLLLSMFSLTVHAQRLVVDKNIVYIEAFGMKSNAVANTAQLADKKQTKAEGGRTKYHFLVDVRITAANPASAWINQLISPRFQIAKEDVSSASATWFVVNGYVQGSTQAKLTYQESGCAIYSESSGDKGTWRVPTFNEILLMQVYSEPLVDGVVSGFVAPKNGNLYASSTTYGSPGSETSAYYIRWGLDLHSPSMTGQWGKYADAFHVRCIRDF